MLLPTYVDLRRHRARLMRGVSIERRGAKNWKQRRWAIFIIMAGQHPVVVQFISTPLNLHQKNLHCIYVKGMYKCIGLYCKMPI